MKRLSVRLPPPEEAWRRLRSVPLRALLARSWPSIIAGATAVALIVWLAWQAGGYFPSAFLPAGAVAFAVLGLLLLLKPPHFTVSTEALVGLAGLLGLAVWTGVSARWSPTPETAIEDMERGVTYAAFFGLGLIAAGSGRFARKVVWLALAVAVAIVGAGLLSRLYPDLVSGAGPITKLGRYRLDYPLDYWNTFGALATLAGVLALGLAADPRLNAALRALAAALVVPLATAMYLSLSRGSWLALAFGLGVLLLLSANRWSLLLTLGLVAGLVAISILAIQGYPALVDRPGAGDGQLAEGSSFGSLLLLLTASAAVIQAVIAGGRASPSLMVGLRRVIRPLLLGIAGLLALAALGAYLIDTTAVDEESAKRLASAEDFVSEQWDEFMQPGAVEATGTERLTTAQGTRSDLYRVAIDGFEAHPVRGDGSGGFQPRFARDRDVDADVRDAHSLYLETLGELGLVGFAFLALFLGSLVTAALRARARPTSMGRSQAAAVTAACAVWAVHAGVDWDWQMPALTGLALFLAASLYPEGRRAAERLRRPLADPRRRDWAEARIGARPETRVLP